MPITFMLNVGSLRPASPATILVSIGTSTYNGVFHQNPVQRKKIPMPARAYWTGQLRLSLVSIPVQLYAATKTASRIAFHQIHQPSGKRVRYEKVVPGIGPIENEEIVKGYEVEKGRYVTVTDEELDSVRIEAKKVIDLVRFVDQPAIDPLYFDRPFFVVPDGEGNEEAYVVLREALKDTKKVGLGQMAIRGQGSLVAVKSCGRGILLETLRYADEVRRSDAFFADIPDLKFDTDLVDLAKELIGRKAGPFKPDEFKDAYTIALRELLDKKIKHEPIREAPEEPTTGVVIDLMEALKRSLGPGAATPARRTASKEAAKEAPKAKAGKSPAKSADKPAKKPAAKAKKAKAKTAA
jgi:DNA end-binding protein Ku